MNRRLASPSIPLANRNGSNRPGSRRKIPTGDSNRRCRTRGESDQQGQPWASSVLVLSRSKDSRPELNRLMADAHSRRFDVIAVWKFDRFARSVSHLLRALEMFQALGIEFVSLSEQIDTSTPTGKMVFTILGAVAELERSLIVDRVRAGMRNARAKGKRIGRPPITFLASQTREAIGQSLCSGRGHSPRIGSQIRHFGRYGPALHQDVPEPRKGATS